MDLHQLLGSVLIPGAVVLLGIAILITFKVIGSRYKRIPPNKVGIFYGRSYPPAEPGGDRRGFIVVAGGGRIVFPLVESYQEMSTAAFQVKIQEDGIQNKDNVPFTIKGIATCKISATENDLNKAAKAFLGKTDEEIEGFVLNILKGHLRSIFAKLNIDDILRNRDDFNGKVIEESTPELQSLGISLINLVLQEINDGVGYLESLGKTAVAVAKRDAEIAVAEADRDSQTQVAEAERTRDIAKSNAARESEVVVAENKAKVLEANKERDVKEARYATETHKERAVSETAFAIAKAAQEKELRVQEAGRDEAEKQAQVRVQSQEKLRREAELLATVIASAMADKEKIRIDAEAEKQKTILDAEATAESITRNADAKRREFEALGEGEASSIRAKAIATADGEAARVKNTLVAQAEGTEKMAEALSKMDDRARVVIILDRLPVLLDKGGDAVAKVMEAIFKSVAAPLGNIDSINIVDIGGKGQGIDKFSTVVPETVLKFMATAKAMGIDVTGILQKLGVNLDDLPKVLGEMYTPSETLDKGES